MYIPPILRGDPSDTRVQNFKPDCWPATDHEFICADLNGQSPAWNRDVEVDDRAELSASGVAGQLHGGKHRGTDRTEQSTTIHPVHAGRDPTLRSVSGRVDWQPQDVLSYDHRPILMDIAVGKRPQRHRRRPRPSLAKADWDKYDRLIEEGREVFRP